MKLYIVTPAGHTPPGKLLSITSRARSEADVRNLQGGAPRERLVHLPWQSVSGTPNRWRALHLL